jgi:hypothetical protein
MQKEWHTATKPLQYNVRESWGVSVTQSMRYSVRHCSYYS